MPTQSYALACIHLFIYYTFSLRLFATLSQIVNKVKWFTRAPFHFKSSRTHKHSQSLSDSLSLQPYNGILVLQHHCLTIYSLSCYGFDSCLVWCAATFTLDYISWHSNKFNSPLLFCVCLFVCFAVRAHESSSISQQQRQTDSIE